MLVYAANGISLKIDPCMSEYKYTWVYAESITFIKSRCDTTKTFVLSMNFPTCFSILRDMLYENRHVNAIKLFIAGFRFELLICSAIPRLDVLYSKKEEAVGSQPDGKNIVFNLESHISKQDSGLPVTECLIDRTLVYLRPCHPVIDAVAYVTVDSVPWLLFIQVSLSEYGDHQSKASL